MAKTKSTAYEIEQAVAAMGDLPEYVEGDDLRVGRQILMNWATDGPGFAANVERAERMSRAQLNEVRDRAYRDVGLPTPGEKREHERFLAHNAEVQRRRRWNIPNCASPGCVAIRRDPNGMPAEVHVRRWWCDEHQHLAEAGDSAPPPLPIDAQKRIVDPPEVERQPLRDEHMKEEQRARNEERALRAREAAEVQRIREERLRAELFGGQR